VFRKAENLYVHFYQRFAKDIARRTFAVLRDRESVIAQTRSSIVHLTLSISACYAQEENQGKGDLPKIVVELLLRVELYDLLVEC